MPLYVQNKNILDTTDITSAGVFVNGIVKEGLECYYDTNVYASWSGSGTWNNLAASHSALTPQNGMTTATFNGATGWNMNFDGAWLSGTYGGNQPNTKGTFEAWIYAAVSEVTSGDRGTIILLTGSCGEYMSWNKSNQYLSTYWYCSSNNGYHETNGPSPKRAWVHWCSVWDNKSGKLFQYVNGTSVGTAVTTNAGSSGTSLSVGREGSSRQFSGSIAEVRIYSRPLHGHEVIQNYLAGQQKYQGIKNGLMMWVDGSNYGSYPAAGSTMTDLSGNGRTVSLVNGYSYNSAAEGSILFDGSAGMGLISSSAPDMAWSPNGSIGNQSMTIEMWVNSSDTDGVFFTKPWNGSGQYNIWIFAGSFYIYAGTVASSIAYGRSLSNGTWTHIVCWMDGTNMGYYMNGKQYSGSQAHGITGAAPSSGNANVGAGLFTLYPYGGGWGGNSGFSINGYMGTTRVYNRVLSAGEANQQYLATKARYGL
jgi:hypothetical protein